MEEKKRSNFFDDFEFNYAIVVFGKLSALQKVKEFLESDPDITIRYQTIDRGKLLIKREEE